MDYVMKGVNCRKSIYDFESSWSLNAIPPNGELSNYNIGLTINDKNKVFLTSNHPKYGTKCFKMDKGSCIYSDGIFKDAQDDIDFVRREFTIDFWVYFDKSYTTFDASTDLTDSNEYTRSCSNPYFFVYGMKNPLFSYLEQDKNGYYYIPQVIAIGYNANTEKLIVTPYETKIYQLQSDQVVPSKSTSFNINGGEYYVDESPLGESSSAFLLFESDLKANQWHHISICKNKDYGISVYIDYGTFLANNFSVSFASTTIYPPDKEGPSIAFGKYGQDFFMGPAKGAFFSIGNQAVPYEQDWLPRTLSTTGSSKNYGSFYIDQLRVVDKYIDIIPEKRVFNINNDAYGMVNGTFQQLATKWSLLSTYQRNQCLQLTDIEPVFDPADIRSVITNSTDDIRLESYTANYTPTSLLLRMDSDHKAIVEPKNLWDIGVYGTIKQVTATYDLDNDGKIMLAPTNDLVNGVYYGYDFAFYQWKPIAASEIETKGIRVDQIGAIPEASWNLLGTDLAFGYFIEAEEEGTDVANLKSIDIKCNVNETQEEALDSIDMTYSYLSPSLLLIRFLTDGRYKVNYLDKEGV